MASLFCSNYAEMETVSQIHSVYFLHITATCFTYFSVAIIRVFRIIKRKLFT